MQGQNIFVFFQRNNPAVHQCLGWFSLASKVIHDEDAARGFELQRRLIGARGWVVYKVKHIKAQFTAGDNCGPLTPHITCVKTARAAQRIGVIHLYLGFGMNDRVIDGDDLTGIFNGAGHIYFVAHRIPNTV